MANSVDRNRMLFTWKIVNFSCAKGVLKSPRFQWKSMAFDVTIHPHVTTDRDSFRVEIRETFDSKLTEMFDSQYTSYCSLAFLDSYGYPLVCEQKYVGAQSYSHLSFMDFQSSPSSDAPTSPSNDAPTSPIHQHHPQYKNENVILFSRYFRDFVKKNGIFGVRKKEFLPNDILTLQCYMSKTKSFCPLNEYEPFFACTKIKPFVTQKSFTWDISNFKSRFLDGRGREESKKESLGESGLLTMKFYNNLHMIFEITVSLLQVDLKVTISVVDTAGRNICIAKDGFLFEETGQVWKLSTTRLKYLLLFNRNAFLPNDTLSLHISCSLSGDAAFNKLVDEHELANICKLLKHNEPKASGTASDTLQGMFEEGFLSDFNLKVGDKLFPVHKAVLGVRSPVFRAMFTSDMKEKEDNCSVIKDADEDTIHRMLQFVYLGQVQANMRWESAVRLYDAADKYAMEELKETCSAILKSGLCAESVVDVLKMADMHKDGSLKSSALEFISVNEMEIVGSDRWKRFEQEDNRLAVDIFRSLFLHLNKKNILNKKLASEKVT